MTKDRDNFQDLHLHLNGRSLRVMGKSLIISQLERKARVFIDLYLPADECAFNFILIDQIFCSDHLIYILHLNGIVTQISVASKLMNAQKNEKAEKKRFLSLIFLRVVSLFGAS